VLANAAGRFARLMPDDPDVQPAASGALYRLGIVDETLV
jgi:hypothetical protein